MTRSKTRKKCYMLYIHWFTEVYNLKFFLSEKVGPTLKYCSVTLGDDDITLTRIKQVCKDSPFKSLRGRGLGNYKAFQGNHILVCLLHAWILRAKGICLLFKMTGPGEDYWSAWIKCLMACRASQTISLQIRAANEWFRALRWSPLFHRVKYSSANS